MLMGGVAFDTPETASEGRRAKNGDQFELFTDFQAAEAGITIFITAKWRLDGSAAMN